MLHQPAAHTDGDVFVFFRRSDVVMAGDVVDTRHFPVIDVEQGGTIDGEIAALNRLTELAIPSVPLVSREAGTLIVPGHGRLGDQLDVVEYRDMVTIIRDRVRDLAAAGKSLDEVQAAAPARGYTRRYGNESGTWTTRHFIEAIYRSLAERHAMSRAQLMLLALVAVGLAGPVTVRAQRQGGRGGRASTAAPAARESAPIDLTGYWVSVVTEDWRYRMVTPAKGEFRRIPVTPAALPIINAWDPAADERAGNQCKGYGAGAIMRVPGRLHVTWEDANTMRVDTDAGTQTRRFHFAPPPAPAGAPSWQGNSAARWDRAPGGCDGWQPARGHHEPARRLPAQERRALQRAGHGHRGLRRGDAARRRPGSRGDGHGRRSGLSGPAVHREFAVQAGAGRLQVGSDAMLIHLVTRRTLAVAVVTCLLAGVRDASAQFELAGAWAPLSTEDVQNDSVPVDFLGLPLTEEARTRALSYDESQKAMIERQCMHWGAAYIAAGSLRPQHRQRGGAGARTRRVLHHRRVGGPHVHHHLDGRPPASLALRPAHAGRLHDGTVGGQHAGGAAPRT